MAEPSGKAKGKEAGVGAHRGWRPNTGQVQDHTKNFCVAFRRFPDDQVRR